MHTRAYCHNGLREFEFSRTAATSGTKPPQVSEEGESGAKHKHNVLLNTTMLYYALRLGISCLTALEGVHQCGLVHHDVQPRNFLLPWHGLDTPSPSVYSKRTERNALQGKCNGNAAEQCQACSNPTTPHHPSQAASNTSLGYSDRHAAHESDTQSATETEECFTLSPSVLSPHSPNDEYDGSETLSPLPPQPEDYDPFRVVISDFGLARDIHHENGANSRPSSEDGLPFSPDSSFSSTDLTVVWC